MWTYSNNPSTSPKDTVRFLLGDTDTSDQLLDDASILFLVAEWGDTYSAAAAGAEQIAGQFAREVTFSGDGSSFSGSELQDKFYELASRLRMAKAKKGRAAFPYAGGISRSDVNSADTNTDEIRTALSMGMHDNGLAGDPSSESNEGGPSSYRNPLQGGVV